MRGAALDELMKAYANEKSTEMLLPHNPIADEFNAVLRSPPEDDPKESHIIRGLRELERERIKYFVKEYVLARLDKIMSSVFIRETLLSPKEKRLHTGRLSLLKQRDVLGGSESVRIEYVGVYCVKSLASVKIDAEVVEIYEGDFLIASFDEVSEYVQTGHLILL